MTHRAWDYGGGGSRERESPKKDVQLFPASGLTKCPYPQLFAGRRYPFAAAIVDVARSISTYPPPYSIRWLQRWARSDWSLGSSSVRLSET